MIYFDNQAKPTFLMLMSASHDVSSAILYKGIDYLLAAY